jgi:hypothetical protein
LRAETITDLVVRTEERQLVWSALRDRAVSAAAYRPADWPPEPDAAILEELLELLAA